MLVTESQRQVRRNLDESMVPAINVVFLLLIFFMMVGHIESRSDLLKIPQSESSVDIAPQSLELKLFADGSMQLQGVELTAGLLDALRASQVSGETTLICHVHRELSASALDPVLAAARQLGIGSLQIATQYLP